MRYVFLAMAIVAEVVATTLLPASDGFRRFLPSVAIVVGYCAAFYFLSLTLRSLPVGVAYAIWSGTGTALIALMGWVIHGQRLDMSAIVGLSLIVSGVVVLNVCTTNQVP